MEWLTQNWIYLLLLLGVILFMRFGGMGCGIGGRRAHRAHGPEQPGAADRPVEPATPTDPVSRRTVDPKTALATIYQGRAYYFESRENRDRFEAAPEQYADAAGDGQKGAGHRHRGGCC
ncbi:MAG: YHS domain-containing protein [Burkholderiaceae bacterium]|nr:YHS domain-containing protein [Burkholderiaceae bacterium]